MQSNIVLFDISDNQLDQLTLCRIWNELLPLFSHRLKLLTLDGNLLTEKSLVKLLDTLEKCAFHSLEYVSLNNCGLSCKCKDGAIIDTCPVKKLIVVLS